MLTHATRGVRRRTEADGAPGFGRGRRTIWGRSVTKDEARSIWDDVQRKGSAWRRRAACKGHSFTRLVSDAGLPWCRCDHCGWQPTVGEKAAYQQGLEHGKKLGFDCTCNPLENTGGGHSLDCPEYGHEGLETVL